MTMRAGRRDGGGGLRLDQVNPAFIVCPGPRVRRPVRGEEPVEVSSKKVRVDGARGAPRSAWRKAYLRA